jgi:hypothetical protein
VTLPFLEKLLQVLAQGGFTATYKYAVLLALIDLCVEAGHPPTSVTTAQLARRVVELYWPQVRPFRGGDVLRQSSNPSTAIPDAIGAFRSQHGDLVAPPRPGPGAPADYTALLHAVEWTLIAMPLPRLQRVGGGEERFLYQIAWGEDIAAGAVRRYQRGEPSAFDNRVRFVAGAAESLVALAAVLRPLVQQHWMAKVRALNRLEDAELDDFLFGAARAGLSRLRAPLQELQAGRCFYCGGALGPQRAEVDHFLPWSRYPDDGLDNLVLAHPGCNRDKLHFLADLDFAGRWQARSAVGAGGLDAVAAAARWPRDRSRTFGVVASVYQGLTEGVRVWGGRGQLRRLDGAALAAVHGFGRGLLGAG